MTRPVVCIDGPSGSGKGTLARSIAKKMGWAYLDSGAIYRVLALKVSRQGLADDQAAGAAAGMELRFDIDTNEVWLDGESVSSLIRTEEAGAGASRLAVRPEVRAALLEFQRQFAAPQPLVADGRDMGTVVFPESPCKIFLEASAEERARRRYKELIDAGKDAIFEGIYSDICARDDRDRNRSAAPLRPAADALILDSTSMSVEEVLTAALGHMAQARLI